MVDLVVVVMDVAVVVVVVVGGDHLAVQRVTRHSTWVPSSHRLAWQDAAASKMK